MDDLREKQIEIEQSMASRGYNHEIEKLLEYRSKGEATRGGSNQIILDAAIIAVAKAIEVFKTEASSGAGRRHCALRAIKGLESSEIAFIYREVSS